VIERIYEIRFSIDDLRAKPTSSLAPTINNQKSNINNRTS